MPSNCCDSNCNCNTRTVNVDSPELKDRIRELEAKLRKSENALENERAKNNDLQKRLKVQEELTEIKEKEIEELEEKAKETEEIVQFRRDVERAFAVLSDPIQPPKEKGNQ